MRQLALWSVPALFVLACAPSVTEPAPTPGDQAAPAAAPSSAAPVPSTPAAPTAAAPKPVAPKPAPTTEPDTSDTACLASATPGTFYALSTKTLGDDLPYGLCNLKGKVVLVVNTASFCGYTPQLETLEPLYQAKRANGLVVAGFPSQSFLQEFDNGKDAKDFCSKRGVTFPMFELGDVKGPNIMPVFSWLTTQPVSPGEIEWNFEKFLISRKGQLIARFATATDPTDPTLVAAIDAALAESP